MHVKNYLENLRPEEYNPEKVIIICIGKEAREKYELNYLLI